METNKSIFKAHARLCLNIQTYIDLQVSIDGSMARYKVSFYQPAKELYEESRGRWQEIKYSKRGLPYITWYNRRLYLADFCKVW